MYRKFYVQIVRAIDRYDIAHDFSAKHLNVLQKHKVKGISSINQSWKYNPDVYIVAVYDKATDQLIGGMRLEISTVDNSLPFETALENKVGNISGFVKEFRTDGGACEFSGLWVDKAYSKLNIPTFMTKQGIELANELGIKNAFAFANNYSRPLTEKLGFKVTKIDEQVVFMYPDKRYPTQLMRKICIRNNKGVKTAVK